MPNKYSEWIFNYLENPLTMGRNCTLLGAMYSDFSLEFKLNARWWVQSDRLHLTSEYKLSFFWLLAHVDQETADSILNWRD